MTNTYSNILLNLINAYSLRISDYSRALNKLHTFSAKLPLIQNKIISALADKISNIVNININILNILNDSYIKEKDIIKLNCDLVTKINEGLKLTDEGLKSTNEGLILTVEGLKSTDEGLLLTVEGLSTTVEGLPTSIEGLLPSDEGLTLSKGGTELTKEELETTNEGLMLVERIFKEIKEILDNSNSIPLSKDEKTQVIQKEPPTPKQIRERIIESPGILSKSFIEHFRSKFKFDKVPARLAFIMEEIYKKTTTTQNYIRSVLKSDSTTIERAFRELRKQGWIKLKSSRRNEQFILTPEGTAFIENIVRKL